MLQNPDRPGRVQQEPSPVDAAFDGIDIDRYLAIGRRQWKVFASCICVGVVLGVVYAVTAVPLYTSSATLLIDNRKVRPVQDAYDVTAPGFDSTLIDSQVEVLKSQKIASNVIAKLSLTKDPLFVGEEVSFIGGILSSIRSSLDFRRLLLSIDDEAVALDEDERMTRKVLKALDNNLVIKRLGRTLALEISYRSRDRAKAAQIANAFANAYLDDQLDSKYDATRRASEWLLERLAELKQKALESDLAIQKYRAEKGLITAGGNLINEQQLAELNTQLVTARSETARAEARYQLASQIVEKRQLDAVIADSIDNTVIEQLRTKYLTASKREAELSNKLGPNHIQAVNLRAEMREYERLIFSEMSRISESYKSELEIARSKEKSLQESFAGLIGISTANNETQVQLREMQREAETFRNLYQTFLQRYQEAVQQQSFPITEARVITQASVAEKPSHPRKTLVVAIAAILGAMAGAGAGAFREFRDRVFRTGQQVRDELGLEFLGMLQAVPADSVAQSKEGPIDPRQVVPRDAIKRYVLDQPLSGFAETLRAVKVAADLSLMDQTPKIIGILSVLPGEGKSTVGKNFASLLAHQGARTLLIDADLRNPGLTRAVAGHAESGLVEAVLDGKPFEPMLMVEPGSKLYFLPAVVRTRISHTSELLTSPGMKAVLRKAGQMFDYIVIDLPPLGPVVDARAFASQIDAFLFVTEWGKTARSMVRNALHHDNQIRDRVLGVVLNKVDPTKLGLYESYGSKDYYYGKYSSYYRDRH